MKTLIRKSLAVVTAGGLVAGAAVVMLAAPAAATAAEQQAACATAGGTYAAKDGSANATCVIVQDPVETTVEGTAEYVPGVAPYDINERVVDGDVESGTPVTTTEYGEWEVVGVRTGGVIEGSCVTKGKSTNTKCQYEQFTDLERTVTEIVTTPQWRVDLTVVDRVTEGTNVTPTTIRTTQATVTYVYNGNSANYSESTSTTVLSEEPGDPIVEDATTTEEGVVIDSNEVELPDDVVSTPQDNEVDTTTVVVTCKNNKGKGDRDNACPTS